MLREIGLAAGGLGSIGFYLYYQNNALQVSRYEITAQQIPAAFDGYKILHCSDLHNKSFGSQQDTLRSLVQKLQPDAICITGDLIDSRRTSISTMAASWEWIPSAYPTFYVPGNHESRISFYPQLLQALQAKQVQILHNTSVMVQRGKESLCFSGIQDPRFFAGRPAYQQMLTQLRQAGSFQILLSHRPEQFDRYQELGYNLVLCGHAHGGQIRLPGTQGLYAPHQGFLPRYTHGMHQQHTTTMVVSRGLGNSGFPFRINNRPQLILITLKHAC